MEDLPEFLNTENNGRDNGGRFLPGNPGKPKGATKNKLRDEIKTFLAAKWSDFPTWFDKLKEKEKIETILSLLPFAVSRLQSIAMKDETEQPKIFVDYTKLSPETLQEILKVTQDENE